MRKFVSALALGAGMIAVTSASAQVDLGQAILDVVVTDNGDSISNQIVIDFTGEYSGSQLLIELTAGSVLDTTSPLPFGAPASTFLSLGDTNIGDGGPIPNIGGGAVDLGGSADALFSAAGINQAWNVAGGATVNGADGFVNAQITLSDDATGTWAFFPSVDGATNSFSGDVVEGVLVVPEPTTAGLLGLAGLSLIARRRKTA